MYRHLLGNAHGSRALIEQVASTSTGSVGGALALARRYRRLIFDGLAGIWNDAPPVVQSRIMKVMARRPDAQSVEFLKRVCKPIGVRARFRAALAMWSYRFSIWPKSLLLFGSLAVFVLAMYTVALWDLTNHNPWGLMRAAEAAIGKAAKTKANECESADVTAADDGVRRRSQAADEAGAGGRSEAGDAGVDQPAAGVAGER